MGSNEQGYEAARSTREPLLTVDEAATLLNVSRRQVYNLIGGGTLPAVRVGRRLRILPAELRASLERRRVGAAP